MINIEYLKICLMFLFFDILKISNIVNIFVILAHFLYTCFFKDCPSVVSDLKFTNAKGINGYLNK